MKTTNEPQEYRRLVTVLSIFIGIFVFLAVVGPRALQPSNIAWFEHGDPAQAYLGWQFFRHSAWSFPIGLNPNFGLEISNAIVFSDSNPLLAIIFKLLSKFLPDTFQYFGIWLLACFILQAWFASKLLGLITKNPVITLLGTCLFSFSPPMIWRLYGHFNLVAHFLILASLYLTLSPSPKRRIVSWAVLLVVSALTHAYLLAMVGLVWGSDIVGRLIKKSLPFERAAIEFSIILLAIFLVCWQAGYFSAGSGVVAGGFGFYRMNLLSIFNPSTPSGWSYVLPDIPGGDGDYEGFNYLGLGVFFLGIFAIPSLFKSKTAVMNAIVNRPMLLACVLGMTAFALSNKLGIGSVNVDFSLPDYVLRMANTFRASGRMFWPVFYLLLFTIILLVVRGYTKPVAIIILGLGLIIQIADTSKAWTGIRKNLMIKPRSTWQTNMVDPFWNEAAAKYSKVYRIMPENFFETWQAVASYAGIHGLATDSVYLARVNMEAFESAKKKASSLLLSGEFEPDSLYFIEDRLLPQIAINLNTQRDLLAKIDGFTIIAPGWKKCSTCAMVSKEINASDYFPPRLRLGEPLMFSKNQPGSKYLINGWSITEAWGTWSDGADASIFIPIEDKRAKAILVEVIQFNPKQNVEIKINGIATNSVTLTSNSKEGFKIIIPDVVRQQFQDNGGNLNIQFHFPDAIRPVDIGVSKDGRKLAIGLNSLTVQ